MVRIASSFDDELVHVLQGGGVAVLRTDTIYGIVARVNNEAAVERVYQAKGRTPTKSPIVLIAHHRDMFDSYHEMEISGFVNLWPVRNSIILPSKYAPDWITRGNESVAYRVPGDIALRDLLEKTGPLIAPSANPEGVPPAMNIQEAINYFHDLVDIYVDGGEVTDNTPSKLFKITDAGLERLR